MNIVLVHGIFCNGRIFRRLVTQLEAQGHRCWAPALKPADGRSGIHDLACKLQRYVDTHLGLDEPFALVGFSMGCIISRQYMQVLGGAARVSAFFAISGPHDGTLTAYLYYGRGATDMRPRSALLLNLKATEDRLAHLPLYAYWTSRDLTIIPAASCDWALAAERVDARALLHRFMPTDKRVCEDIVQRLSTL
ncbi:MAG: alpha/beta fold hydrolase [Comamonadaceae bacterium]|nr:MAG: alpha/beta fold hydrolase [Comamonadaceae bacterium]